MEVDDEDVEVEICDEALAWPSMVFISAIEFCISSRSCLTALAADDDEADFEEEEDEREDDINRCVEEVLAILDVVVVVLLVDEDTLELLLLLEAEFRSFFVIFYRHLSLLGYISRWALYSNDESVSHLALARCHICAQITQLITLNRVL